MNKRPNFLIVIDGCLDISSNEQLEEFIDWKNEDEDGLKQFLENVEEISISKDLLPEGEFE